MKHYLIAFLLLNVITANAQKDIYNITLKQELGYLGAGVTLSALGSYFVSNSDPATLEEINALDPTRLWGIDRGAINNNSANAKKLSDVILYSSLSIPLFVYVSRKCRMQGTAVGFMAIEALLITNGLTSISKGVFKRYRPLNYNPDVDLDTKLGGSSRRSFFSGHASTTAALSFFTAKVLTDLYPDLKHEYLVWTVAATIPATISYLRYKAGKHFLTDVFVGYAVGASIGYLIPALHLSKDVSLSAIGTGGLALRVKW